MWKQRLGKHSVGWPMARSRDPLYRGLAEPTVYKKQQTGPCVLPCESTAVDCKRLMMMNYINHRNLLFHDNNALNEGILKFKSSRYLFLDELEISR